MTNGPANLVMKVESNVLHRLLYNARLYQVGKDAPGAQLFWGQDGGLLMSVFDRYTYLEDYATYEPGKYDYHMELGAGMTKDLEMALRDVDDQLLTVEVNTSDRVMVVEWSDITVAAVDFDYPARDTEDVASLVSPAEHMGMTESVALYGDRFRKLALIQPQEYPVDMKIVEHVKFGPMVAFKKGPSVIGAVAALDKEILKKDLSVGRELW